MTSTDRSWPAARVTIYSYCLSTLFSVIVSLSGLNIRTQTRMFMSVAIYSDLKIKKLNLMPLEIRRHRSDLIETFKIINGCYNLQSDLF